jgi:hypothetical protein
MGDRSRAWRRPRRTLFFRPVPSMAPIARDSWASGPEHGADREGPFGRAVPSMAPTARDPLYERSPKAEPIAGGFMARAVPRGEPLARTLLGDRSRGMAPAARDLRPTVPRVEPTASGPFSARGPERRADHWEVWGRVVPRVEPAAGDSWASGPEDGANREGSFGRSVSRVDPITGDPWGDRSGLWVERATAQRNQGLRLAGRSPAVRQRPRRAPFRRGRPVRLVQYSEMAKGRTTRSTCPPRSTPTAGIRRAQRVRKVRARPADATQVALSRRSIRAEVGCWQGETGAAAEGSRGVGGRHTSEEVGERGGTRTRLRHGGPC